MRSLVYDENSLLLEIYDLEEAKFDIVRENVRYMTAYQISGDESILVEGFTDILGKMGNFFKMMIEKIKEFFKKILAYISACFMDIDKFVKKYRKELDALDNLDFDVDGFEWTMHNAPNMDAFKQVVAEYNSELAGIEKKKKEDIVKAQNEFLTQANLDKLRGQVLGANRPISEDDFHEEVRKYYRDGSLDETSIHIDTAKFKKIIDDVPDLMKQKKEAEKTRDDLIILLDKTQRFFNQKGSVVYVSGKQQIKTNTISVDDNNFKKGEDNYDTSYSISSMDKVEKFLRFKYNQSNKLAGMINLVASERANAYKDQVKMVRTIIKKALFKSKDDDEMKKANEGLESVNSNPKFDED